MESPETTELLHVLVQDYLLEKENNRVWQRENSLSYAMALGKLLGACTALGLEIVETKEVLLIKAENVIIVEKHLEE